MEWSMGQTGSCAPGSDLRTYMQTALPLSIPACQDWGPRTHATIHQALYHIWDPGPHAASTRLCAPGSGPGLHAGHSYRDQAPGPRAISAWPHCLPSLCTQELGPQGPTPPSRSPTYMDWNPEPCTASAWPHARSSTQAWLCHKMIIS